MKFVDEVMTRYPVLAPCRDSIEQAVRMIVDMYRGGNQLMLCGNGGSAADCDHISGELLKGFLSKRPFGTEELNDDLRASLQKGVPAIPLTGLCASLSAFQNDVEPSLAYAQLALALGKENDILWGISTSGNSKNVCQALQAAKYKKIKTIALTGQSGGKLKEIADVTIQAPETETYRVQELHLPIYHTICAQVEYELFVRT